MARITTETEAGQTTCTTPENPVRSSLSLILSRAMSSHLAEVEGVEGEVSGLAVLLVHVDDGGEKQDLGERDPEEELPHGALLHLFGGGLD